MGARALLRRKLLMKRSKRRSTRHKVGQQYNLLIEEAQDKVLEIRSKFPETRASEQLIKDITPVDLFGSVMSAEALGMLGEVKDEATYEGSRFQADPTITTSAMTGASVASSLARLDNATGLTQAQKAEKKEVKVAKSARAKLKYLPFLPPPQTGLTHLPSRCRAWFGSRLERMVSSIHLI